MTCSAPAAPSLLHALAHHVPHGESDDGAGRMAPHDTATDGCRVSPRAALLRLVDHVQVQADAQVEIAELWIDGAPTHARVPGVLLEAAVACPEGYLLFTSGQRAGQALLHIVRLAADLTVTDLATIQAPGGERGFHALTLHDDVVRFRFIGETAWRVDLLPRACGHLPLLSEPVWVRRPLGRARQFLVSGAPVLQPCD